VFTLTVEGFQSIEEPVTLEIDRLTVLGGESHIGKTATIRAFHAAFSNKTGTNYISVGKDRARLTWKTSQHTLVWEKKGSSTTYIIDGKKIHRPGRGVIPTELLALGIREVITTDRCHYWPQIQFQGEPPFILSERSPVTAAELLGSTSETVTLNRALKLVSGDINRIKTLCSVLEDQQTHNHLRLQVIDPVQNSIENDFHAHEQEHKDLEEFQTSSNQLELLHQKYNYLAEKLDKTKISPELTWGEIPDVVAFQQIHRLATRYEELKQAVALNQINISSLDDGLSERKRAHQLESIYHKLMSLVRRSLVLKPLDQIAVPPRYEVERESQRVSRYMELERQYRQAQQRLEGIHRKTVTLQKNIQELNHESSLLHRDLNEVEYCPVCEAPLKGGKYDPGNGQD
jgi:hypothetical protein